MIKLLKCQQKKVGNPDDLYALVLEVLRNLISVYETDLTPDEQAEIRRTVSDYEKGKG